MKESNFARECLLAASMAGARMFLNPRGQGWVGKLVSYVGGILTLRGASKVTFGVGPDGAGDALGWQTVIVTPDMVGKPIAVFCSWEFKTETGRIRKGQPEWRDAVIRAGGRAGIVRSTEEALAVLNGISP